MEWIDSGIGFFNCCIDCIGGWISDFFNWINNLKDREWAIVFAIISSIGGLIIYAIKKFFDLWIEDLKRKKENLKQIKRVKEIELKKTKKLKKQLNQKNDTIKELKKEIRNLKRKK